MQSPDGDLRLERVLGETCARVVCALRSLGQATASELGDRLDLTANGVRRHLRRLEGAGLVSHVVERQQMGRPVHVYALSSESDGLFHSAVLDAAVVLGQNLRDDGERARLGERIFARLLRRTSSSGHPRPDSEVAGRERLIARLQSAGFAPAFEPVGGEDELCLHHCPFRSFPEVFPEICAAERTWLEGALGTELRRTEWLLDGDRRCCYAPVDPDGPSPSPGS